MRIVRGHTFVAVLMFVAGAAFAQADTQTPPVSLSFTSVTIKPSPPVSYDPQAFIALARAGKMPKVGPYINGTMVEFDRMPLRSLILYAYNLQPYQLKSRDDLTDHPYDITATMPTGASRDDARKMLQALLETRFKLKVHRESKSQQVMALVLAKDGPKLKEASPGPPPTDNGVRYTNTPDGPVLVSDNGHEGSTVAASRVTMAQLADLLALVLNSGNNRGRSGADMSEYGGDWQAVVDQTGLTGEYQVAFNSSLTPTPIMVRVAGRDAITTTPAGQISQEMIANTGPPQPDEALDPVVFASLLKLGLKLERSKAPVEQLVVDHVEKKPTDN